MMNKNEIPHMLGIKETARMFGVAEHFIRGLAKSGKIICVRAGNKYLINCDKHVEYFNSSKETAPTGAAEESVSDITPIPVKL